MKVQVFKTLKEYDQLRENWTHVYSQDPHATVFVSWSWLRGWIQSERREWMVLALRSADTSSYIGFMVVAGNHRRPWNVSWLDDIHMGGNTFSDHTGFVCLPEFSDAVIAKLAAYIKNRLSWATCTLRDVFDPRLKSFLAQFPKKSYTVHWLKSTEAPCIQLPDTWDAYLRGCMTKSRRFDINRCMRKAYAMPKFRITEICESNVDAQIDTVLQLHVMRFGSQDRSILERYKALLLNCFLARHLWLTIIWDGDTPMAGLAAFVDPGKGMFAYYLGGFNNRYAALSPASILQAHSIRYAIENGYREYDFLRGSEPYKYSYGAKDRFNDNVTIRRAGVAGLLAHWDEICKRKVKRIGYILDRVKSRQCLPAISRANHHNNDGLDTRISQGNG